MARARPILFALILLPLFLFDGLLAGAQEDQQPADAETVAQVSSVLTDAQQSLFDKNYHAFIDTLSRGDRERLQQDSESRLSRLAPLIDTINKEWMKRYHEEFNQRLDRPGFSYLVEQRPDKHVAVELPADHAPRPVSLDLVDEGRLIASWHLVVPQLSSAEQLQQALQTVLREIAESKDAWPDDPEEAYRITTQKLFAALTGNREAMHQAMKPPPAQREYQRARIGDFPE